MTELEKAQSLLTGLSRRDKLQILERLVRELGDSFPGIEATHGVLGGEPRIVRTRIPVWTLVRARQLGASDADLLQSYPSLRLEDLVHAWAFYEVHRESIDRQIQAHEAA